MATTYYGTISSLLNKYRTDTPQKLKIIDIYLTYILFTGIIQFVYCVLVGTFPFNSFLAGFLSAVGSFVLTVALRIQVNANNRAAEPKWSGLTDERAFADYLLCNIILHLVVFNFLG